MRAFVITLRRSSVRKQLLKIFSSETTWPLETKLWWNGPWVVPFQNCIWQSRPPTNMVAVTKNKKGGWNSKNLHLWNYWANWNETLLSPLMTPFQNCVRQSRHPTNMATVAKNRKGGWNFNCFPLKLLGQLDLSFAEIMLWWSPFKMLSGSPVLGSRSVYAVTIY
jgi:hypothetical protein